ncbi:ABC-three component system protein [Pseudomonas sp. GT1P32]
MIRRFRLEQKGRYEKLVIAQRLSDMVDKFLDGRPAPLGIGAEQGGIAEWDDVVIYHSDEHWEHLQIKRQTSGFSEKHLNKADYLASYKPRKTAKATKTTETATAEEKPKTPSDDEFDSELEKVFKSLATWQPPGIGVKPSTRTFSLTLPGPEVLIKGKGKDIIKITHLREVWDLCRKDGVDFAGLSKRDDKPTQNVYTWLTTWCGFIDWAHIVEKMRMLEIHCIGDESTLEARARESLDRHFSDSAMALSVLLDYIADSTTDTNAVSCHTAAKHLQKLLLPGVQTWTQYLANPVPGQSWTVTGTHDIGSTPTVPHRNPAEQIVSHHWAESIPNRRLRLHAKYARPTKALTLPSAILRLALHLKKGSESMLLGEPAWRQGAHNELRSTLGDTDRDLDGLPWFDNSEALSCPMGRELSFPANTKVESDALHSAMNDLVWHQLQICVDKKLNEIVDHDLSTAVAEKWQIWRADLDKDPDARLLLFEQMMYPQTEGINAKHALRIGPRTVELMESATIMLLLTCVGLGGIDWRSIEPIGDVLSIALRHWSGVPTDHDGPRRLGDDNLRKLLGQAPPPVVILSGVEGSATELLEAGMAEDLEAGHSMAAERQPRLLVTRFQVYKQLRTGTLVKLQAHFQKHWNAWLQAREAAIEACGKGH